MADQEKRAHEYAAVLVRVVEPFEEDRTPCPRIGTVGRLIEFGKRYVKVEFDLPFVDTDGTEWLPWDHHQTMELKFLPDEIEPAGEVRDGSED